MQTFIKYPKTYHLQDALAQNKAVLPNGAFLLAEEKMDGTQVGISFDEYGQFQLQSRGTVITSEPEFSLLKQWLWQYHQPLYDILQQRYIMFGEWLYAQHTLYYDLLPSYFLEFDIYDRTQKIFLSTAARQQLLSPMGADLHAVRVVGQFTQIDLQQLHQLIHHSAFISERAYQQLPVARQIYTDCSGRMEGLYLKVENAEQVLARYKLIRPEFVQLIVKLGEHWKSRGMVKNQLGG